MPIMHRTIVRIALMMLCASAILGEPRSHRAARQCKHNTELVGQCFQIHGRAFTSNGTPDLRIWEVGTKRILGVTAHAQTDDADDPSAPSKLLDALGAGEHFVFGDFEVCPFTPKRLGQMQMVCVERAAQTNNQAVWDTERGFDDWRKISIRAHDRPVTGGLSRYGSFVDSPVVTGMVRRLDPWRV